ncbi:TPA: AAA family ATPase [Providencia alcalifaciens]
MKFDIEIRNFGKIKHAKINIRPFTIISGHNSSGKSFVTKVLYSYFNTIKNDYLTSNIFENIGHIKTLTSFISRKITAPLEPQHFIFDEVNNIVSYIETIINSKLRSNTYTTQLEGLPLLQASMSELKVNIDTLADLLEEEPNTDTPIAFIDAIKININNINEIISKPELIFANELGNSFKTEILENFQVSSINELKNFHAHSDERINFNFDSLGQLSIRENDSLEFTIPTSSVDLFQKLYNVVYIESPVYWKLKDSLLTIKNNKNQKSILKRDNDIYLSGVPKHFYDLLDLLSIKAKDTDSLIESQFTSNIEKAINGKLSISPTGEIEFSENNSPKPVNIHSTAMGITNLGIIALLLKKAVIAKGSYLFIDEPEVNLHPSWQKIMIETLFNLSLNGINIVIATHSIDMLKCVENIISKHNELVEANHFGINQLNTEGNTVELSQHPLKRVVNIKNDLSESYYDLFLDGSL